MFISGRKPPRVIMSEQMTQIRRVESEEGIKKFLELLGLERFLDARYKLFKEALEKEYPAGSSVSCEHEVLILGPGARTCPDCRLAVAGLE